MKTQEILNKYRAILSGILECEPEEIKFFVDDRGSLPEDKDISCLFNFTSIIYKLDEAYKTEIAATKRTKGVYAIKTGDFGERIEYRSLPNTIHHMALIGLLKEFK